MRKMIGALALALGLGWAAQPAHAQDHAGHGQHADAMAEHMEQMHQMLGLTEQQVAQLRQVHARHAQTLRAHCEQMAATGADAHANPQLHERLMEEMQAVHHDMLAVLTDAQKARLDSIQAAHHAEHAEVSTPYGGDHMMAPPGQAGEMARMHAMHEAMCRELMSSRR